MRRVARWHDAFTSERHAWFARDDRSRLLCHADGPAGEAFLDHEFAYEPDYVDEYVAQSDGNGRANFMLRDGNYNVVALVADEVHPDGTSGRADGGGGG